MTFELSFGEMARKFFCLNLHVAGNLIGVLGILGAFSLFIRYIFEDRSNIDIIYFLASATFCVIVFITSFILIIGTNKVRDRKTFSNNTMHEKMVRSMQIDAKINTSTEK